MFKLLKLKFLYFSSVSRVYFVVNQANLLILKCIKYVEFHHTITIWWCHCFKNSEKFYHIIPEFRTVCIFCKIIWPKSPTIFLRSILRSDGPWRSLRISHVSKQSAILQYSVCRSQAMFCSLHEPSPSSPSPPPVADHQQCDPFNEPPFYCQWHNHFSALSMSCLR